MKKEITFTIVRYAVGLLPYIAISLVILSFDSGRSSIMGNPMTLWERGYNLFNSTLLGLTLEMIGGCVLWYWFCKLLIIVGGRSTA